MTDLTICALASPAADQLSLEACMALTEARMTLLLERHTDGLSAPVTPDRYIAETLPRTEPESPVAALLSRAHSVLVRRGWAATGASCETDGRLCVWGAILVADGRGPRSEGSPASYRAASYLLDRIRREFAGSETLPSWNDAQHGPAAPLRVLGEAAEAARTENI